MEQEYEANQAPKRGSEWYYLSSSGDWTDSTTSGSESVDFDTFNKRSAAKAKRDERTPAPMGLDVPGNTCLVSCFPDGQGPGCLLWCEDKLARDPLIDKTRNKIRLPQLKMLGIEE